MTDADEHSPNTASHALCEATSLYALIEEQAARVPDALALLAPDRSPLTYAGMISQLQRTIRTLNGFGLGRNDCVALSLPNGPEMAVCSLAAASCASCAPLNPAYQADELDFYLRSLGAKALIVQAGLPSAALGVARSLGLTILELHPDLGGPAGLFSLHCTAPSPARVAGIAHPDDMALLLHTSGTTSRPKIVPLTHRNLLASLSNIRAALALSERDRCLNVMPLFHVGGLLNCLLATVSCGASVVCTPGFDPARFFSWIDAFHPTWFTAVPTIFQMVLSCADPGALAVVARRPIRLLRSSSSPLSPAMTAALEQVFCAPVIDVYGMTETASHIAGTPLPPRPRKPGSVGVPMGTEVAIKGEDGALLPPGQRGEVVLRGPGVISAYLNDPEANATSFSDGWFRTGDLGYFDEDGYLFLTGRLKEIINRGGEKISPGEVEQVLLRHPDVQQAVVFPVPHPSLEEDVAAAVVLRPGGMATGAHLRALASSYLADHKVPQQILIVAEVPLGRTGKVQRRSLAKRFAAALSTHYQAPHTSIMEALARIWAQALARPQVGVEDNFFALGGQSLLATQVLSRVRDAFGVDLPIRSLFESPTVAALASVLEAALGSPPAPVHAPLDALGPVPHGHELPVSFSQQRLWFLEQLAPGGATYNLSAVLRLEGSLDVGILERSMAEVIGRHEALRTTFAQVQGRPVQVIAPAAPPFSPARVDLRTLPAEQRDAAAMRRAVAFAQRPFDLERGPLWRATLLRLGDTEHLLVLILHHIIADGWSLTVLLRELRALYEAFREGRPAGLPPLPLQYPDFALWQRRWMQGRALEEQLLYWRRKLDGAPPVLQLPTDHPRPAVQSFRGTFLPVHLSDQLTQQLQHLARQEGVTLFMLLLAVFQVLLCRYTGQKDIVVGVPIANRHRGELEGLIGFFVNTLALRTDCSGNSSFRELLGRVKETALGAFAHQDLPFERLVEELQGERDLSRSPLVQVMFAFQNTPPIETRAADLCLSRVSIDNGTAKLDLTLALRETPDGLRGELEYSTDLFEQSAMQRLLGHFSRLLEGVVADPDQRIEHLPLLTEQERHRLLVAWNDTREAPSETCVHYLFEEHARRRPDAVAVELEGGSSSYGLLNARANQLARHLRALGVGPQRLVGIFFERSVEMVISILATLKAGAAYVPLDPSYPKDRLAFMLADSKALVLLTTQRLAQDLPPHHAQIVCLDQHEEDIARRAADDLPALASIEDLAYVIYTSGSTGRPKGVLLPHRALSNLIAAQVRILSVDPQHKVLQFAPFSFDASVWETFLALSSGATLSVASPEALLPGPDLLRLLHERAITTVALPPSALAVLPQHALPALHTLIVAGEACPQEVAARWVQGRRFFNAYGPTETTVCACIVECKDGVVPPVIGRPQANTQVYILDPHMQPVPIGVAGEMYISGLGVARGYLNRPELTAERFVPDPFSQEPGARLYRTGDLGRYLPDGNIEFVGRIDHQVKIRGFRIELGEIEATLHRHSAVREAVVLAQEAKGRGQTLVAYATLQPGLQATSQELRAHLRRSLPDYMVPSFLRLLPEMPLTPNGKIDRKALPPPQQGGSQDRAGFVEPRTPMEKRLAGIWQEVLHLEEVGTQDNFFDLGGHSLLLAEVHARLPGPLGHALKLVDLFHYPTVSALARHLGEHEPERLDQLQDACVERAYLAGERLRGEASLKIAVIGLAGRFPGARDVAQLWDNIKNGVESISRFSDDELTASGLDPALVSDPNYVKASGVLEDFDRFDAAFFGVPPREAQIMDPQHRLLLECAWEALEDAGIDPQSFKGVTGIYAGCGPPSYLINHLMPHPALVRTLGRYPIHLANAADFLCTRVAYKLNLKGPALTVQTACSSSLVAVHLACTSLLRGECDLVLAGGVSLGQLQKGYHYQEGMIHSPDGHCRAFDAAAQGTVSGQGVGLVVLKRLEDALQNGDPIRAVILGSATNNDGSAKAGFTAPGVDGQASVIRAAHIRADVSADTITYVEAHGTGTNVGDPIEVTGLTQAFRISTDRKQICALGSVKTNIGHADAASGVAGLIKTVLALEHRQLPPSLHFEQPNPQIDFASSPFYVNTRLRPWPAGDTPRRAGVSSFGLGGHNAHLVLEEAPAREPTKAGRPFQLLLLSARTPAALEAQTNNLTQHLRRYPEVELADVAYTLQLGRRAFAHRRAVVCKSPRDALQTLELGDRQRLATANPPETNRPVAFLFPGQGSQYAGMGRDLYHVEPTFREAVDQCSEILRQRRSDVVLGFDREMDDEAARRIDAIEIGHPLLFTLEYALSRLLMEWGVRPRYLLGHSVGEYVAACLAGVFSLEDALLLVAQRARLIQSVPPGAMLSLGSSEEAVVALLDRLGLRERLSLAAVNGPYNCVISGPEGDIERVRQYGLEQGMAARRIHASRAFHSSMLEPVLDAFHDAVTKTHRSPPQTPVVSNLTGTWLTPEQATDPVYWVQHLRQTVSFSKGIQTLLAAAEDLVLVEVGPGRTLTTLTQQHPARGPRHAGLSTVRQAQEERHDSEHLLAALGRLWLEGVDVDWTGFHAHSAGARVPLPTYPFERLRYWIDPPRQDQRAAAQSPLDVLAELPEADPAQAAQEVSGPAPPRDDVEHILAKLWQEHLGVAPVGSDADFFQMGGDSLVAVRMVARLCQAFQVPLPSHVLLRHSTLGSLAALIKQLQAAPALHSPEERSSLLVNLQPGRPGNPTLFLVHPVGGHVYFYRDLCNELGGDIPVYAVRARSDAERLPGPLTMEGLATDYIEQVQKVQPQGPYFLGGSSFGGMVAFEMALQLRAQGYEVPVLAMIDTPGPNHMPKPAKDPTSDLVRRFQQVMLQYVPRDYPGRILFYRATDLSPDLACMRHVEQAWVPLAARGVVLHVVPGDHFSMNTSPNVGVLARHLRSYLTEHLCEPREDFSAHVAAVDANAGYRARRDAVIKLAAMHVRGEEVPLYSYAEEDHQTWRTFTRSLAPHLEEHACREYREASRRVLVAQDLDHVPQQRDVSKRLHALTRFGIEPAVGLLDAQAFYDALTRRMFPSTPFLRDPQALLFTDEPDWAHELIGHVVMLGSARIARLYELFARAMMATSSPDQIDRISALYWYVMEVGLVREEDRWRVVGAAILSSVSEMKSLASVEIRPFDPAVVEIQPVDVTKPQHVLFGAASFDDLLEQVAARLEQHIQVAGLGRADARELA